VACFDSDSGDTVEAVCTVAERDEADLATCGGQTDCGSCTSTLKADGSSTCEWYAAAVGDGENLAYCGVGGCDFNGICGTKTCASGNPAECESLSGCDNCVQAGCAWTNGGTCVQTCTAFATTPCYSSKRFRNRTSTEICDVERRDVADEALCRNQTSCASCTSTSKTNGAENCQWYKPRNNTFSKGYCGTGRCDENWRCGSSQCDRPRNGGTSETLAASGAMRATPRVGHLFLALVVGWAAWMKIGL
jgi:hypothetical protein